MPRENVAENPERIQAIEDAVEAVNGRELYNPDKDEYYTLSDKLSYYVEETTPPVGNGTNYNHLVRYAGVAKGKVSTYMVWLQSELNERGYYVLFTDLENDVFDVASLDLAEERRERDGPLYAQD